MLVISVVAVKSLAEVPISGVEKKKHEFGNYPMRIRAGERINVK